MTLAALALRNLLYHLRGNGAVFLGVALGSAVLTGALLVGDSLRGSLRDLTLDQLGWVDSAMTPGRFFRQDLKLPAEHSAAVLMLRGSADIDAANVLEKTPDGKTRPYRLSVPVQVIGVDSSFSDTASEMDRLEQRRQPNVAVNEALSATLEGWGSSGRFTLNLQKNDAIPRARRCLANARATMSWRRSKSSVAEIRARSRPRAIQLAADSHARVQCIRSFKRSCRIGSALTERQMRSFWLIRRTTRTKNSRPA